MGGMQALAYPAAPFALAPCPRPAEWTHGMSPRISKAWADGTRHGLMDMTWTGLGGLALQILPWHP